MISFLFHLNLYLWGNIITVCITVMFWVWLTCDAHNICFGLPQVYECFSCDFPKLTLWESECYCAQMSLVSLCLYCTVFNVCGVREGACVLVSILEFSEKVNFLVCVIVCLELWRFSSMSWNLRFQIWMCWW